MYNLIVDIGNTAIKYALFSGDEIVSELRQRSLDGEELCEWLKAGRVLGAIVSSTRGDATDVEQLLRGLGIDVLMFTSDTAVPIQNDYHTPKTLGRDRLAAAVGASALYPNRDVLIVDFGTAITIDLVSAGRYCGGFISPGRDMRFKALNHFTASLPLVGADVKDSSTGLSTEESISLGVTKGICYEIEGHISQFREEFANLMVIFTGGEAKDFVKRIKNTIFADCDLVIKGLNRILEYNAHVKK